MIVRTNGTQKQSQSLDISASKSNHILHYEIDYDSQKPEQTIRDFVGNIKAMIAKYDYNKTRIVEIEQELVDIYHYIEISTFKTVPNGYKLYRKLAELRRERRACKNENDLLFPIYQYFHATNVLDKLSNVQGECGKAKSAIDGRAYMVRTDILSEWLDPEEEKEPVNLDNFTESDLAIDDLDPVTEDIPEEDEIEELAEEVKDDPTKIAKFKLAWKAAN